MYVRAYIVIRAYKDIYIHWVAQKPYHTKGTLVWVGYFIRDSVPNKQKTKKGKRYHWATETQTPNPKIGKKDHWATKYVCIYILLHLGIFAHIHIYLWAHVLNQGTLLA